MDLPAVHDLAKAGLAQAEMSYTSFQEASTTLELKVDDVAKGIQELRMSLFAQGAPTEAVERATIVQLAAAPSFLRDACDTMSQKELVVRPRSDIPRPCQCRERRIKSMQRSKWGYFSVFQESLLVRKHFPGCALAKYNPEESSRAFGITLSSLPIALFGKAVDLSYRMSYGAGGSSISPLMTLYTMVNERGSPAFRALNCLAQCRNSMDDK